jgi:hypothetical protein
VLSSPQPEGQCPTCNFIQRFKKRNITFRNHMKIIFIEFVRYYTVMSAMKKVAKSFITSLISITSQTKRKGDKFGGVRNNIL